MRAHAAVNPAPKHPPVRHDPYLGRQRAYENTGEWWKSCARAAIKQLARSHPDGFTSDDLRRFPGLPDPDTEKRWGAILNAAARGDDPVTEDTGTRRASTLPSANGRKVIVWIGTAKYRSAAA
jgi:hypothetical protein